MLDALFRLPRDLFRTAQAWRHNAAAVAANSLTATVKPFFRQCFSDAC
jgi:hypothetical protein